MTSLQWLIVTQHPGRHASPVQISRSLSLSISISLSLFICIYIYIFTHNIYIYINIHLHIMHTAIGSLMAFKPYTPFTYWDERQNIGGSSHGSSVASVPLGWSAKCPISFCSSVLGPSHPVLPCKEFGLGMDWQFGWHPGPHLRSRRFFAMTGTLQWFFTTKHGGEQ